MYKTQRRRNLERGKYTMSINENSKIRKILVSLGKVKKLFVDQMREPYIALLIKGSFRIMAIGSKEFRQLVVSRAFSVTRQIISQANIAWVIAYLEAQAVESGYRITLVNRFAQRQRRFLLDLADRRGRAVIVMAQGWRVVRLRIVFRRYAHQRPINKPSKNGNVRLLFEYLSVQSDVETLLILGWLGCTFLANLSRPILCLHGPQGERKNHNR
jgi:hypothetical protein